MIRVYGFEADDLAGIEFDKLSTDEIRDALWARIAKAHADKEALLSPEFMRKLERDIMLQIVDQQWKDHLYSLDHLKEGIGLRGYGQRDPLVEYKRESFAPLPGHEGPDRGRHRPASLAPASGAQRGRRRRLRPCDGLPLAGARR